MAAGFAGAAAARRALGGIRSAPIPSAIASILRSPSAPPSSPTATVASTFTRLSRRKLSRGISRIPVELGSAQSLMPLHSVTASALLNSMLASKPGGWAWLSEGFATPL